MGASETGFSAAIEISHDCPRFYAGMVGMRLEGKYMILEEITPSFKATS
jgi:hypothetical protein